MTSNLAQHRVGDVEIVEQIWWYTSRSAGIVAWTLLSLSVIAGMAMSSRDARRMPTGWPIDLHRFTSMLSLVFLSVHIVSLVPDNFVHFAWAELFVPFASEWQPGAVAWGIVAFWLVVAVQVSSLLRSRIPTKVWRALHFLSFVVWLSATVHLFTAGTDVGHQVFRIVQVVVIGAVALTFVRRLVLLWRPRSARVRTLSVEESVDVDEVDAGERRELPA